MTLIGSDIPGRQGWSLGPVVISGSESRSALTHVESGYVVWVWGRTLEERTDGAQTHVDGLYQSQWDRMADVIEEGDRRGPNVKLLDAAASD